MSHDVAIVIASVEPYANKRAKHEIRVFLYPYIYLYFIDLKSLISIDFASMTKKVPSILDDVIIALAEKPSPVESVR